MFAESLLESSPHIGHRAGWTKLTSLLLQCMAVAVLLAIPLFHVESLQVLPPLPSIRLMSAPQPVVRTDNAGLSRSAASDSSYIIVQPRSIPQTVGRGDDHKDAGPSAPQIGTLCVSTCGTGLPVGIVSSSTFDIPKPPVPTHPMHVSEMQLGAVVHKVLPEYPAIAKQIRLQGAVVLLATIAKDGHVDHVEPISGPPMLVLPAKRAVEQWQYRPYILNHEPVIVQTQITVNFVLNNN